MARRRKRRVRAGAPALECTAAESGMVVAELRRLRRAPGPSLGGVNCVLDGRNDLVAILANLPWNVADLWRRRSRPRSGPKLSVRAPGNIR